MTRLSPPGSRRSRLSRAILAFFLGLLEYVPLLVTVGLASYVSFYADSKFVTDRDLLQYIIAILGLTAVSQVLERFYRLRGMTRALSELSGGMSEILENRTHSTQFYVPELPDVRDLITKSRQIYLINVNAQQFVLKYKNELADRVHDGTELRILVVDPQSDAAKQIANPPLGLTVEYIAANSAITRQTLTWLKHECKGKDSVAMRYMSYVPMFASYAFDFHETAGTIIVGLYRQFWSHDTRRPFTILNKQRDGYWYDYYAQQLDEAWVRGVEVDLSHDHPSPSGKS